MKDALHIKNMLMKDVLYGKSVFMKDVLHSKNMFMKDSIYFLLMRHCSEEWKDTCKLSSRHLSLIATIMSV